MTTNGPFGGESWDFRVSRIAPIASPADSSWSETIEGSLIAWSTRPAGSTHIVALSTASTITGWAFYAGVPGAAFDRITIPIMATQAGYLPTSARIRIKHTDINGAVLADAQIPVSCQISIEATLDFRLPATISTSQPIWIEIFTNGRIQVYTMTTSGGADLYPSASYPATKYATRISISDPVASGASGSQYYLVLNTFLQDGSLAGHTVAPDLASALASGSWLSRVATMQPALVEVASVGVASFTSVVVASTFSGLGCYIGNQSVAFDGIALLLWPYDASNVPTLGRLRIRRMPSDSGTWGSTNPATWNVIAESNLVDLGLTYNTWREVVFHLNKVVTGHVWFELVTNGYLGLSGTTGGTGSPTIASPPAWSYVTNKSIGYPNALGAATPHQTIFCRLGICDFGGGQIVASAELKAQISGATSSNNPTVYISLPTNAQNLLPALEGRELSIYFENVIWSSVPLDQLCIDVTCTKGTQWSKYWRYTPTSGDAGTTTLTLAVYTKDRGTLLATATATLKTVALSNPASPVTRKLLLIGDSTMASGEVAAELFNLFVGDTKYTLTLVGSNSGNASDSASNSRAVATEAIAGWTINGFTTDSTTAWTQLSGGARTGSPFSFSSVFNFASYLSSQSISMSSGDWVVINLGINDVFNSTDDATVNTRITTMSGQLASWITSIKASVPGIRIGICLTIPPSCNQDAFGYNYGSGQTRLRYIRNLKLWRDAITTSYDTSVISNVFVIPYHANLDTEHNFTTGSVAVNSRNATTYTQQQNGVHPAASGYYQLSDMLRSWLKAAE